MPTLTEHTHKSLLPIAGKPALERAIDEVLARDVAQVVVVTGDKRESVERFVRDRYGDRITLTFNERYASDTNILSTEMGVAALRRPGDGYMIVETDLAIAAAGWEVALDVGDRRRSSWVTQGEYGAHLTGGALRSDATGRVTGLVYAPTYDPAYDGWQKLLGILYVGSEQVEVDRHLRQRGIERSLAQYYMTPWVENLSLLACWARPLGDHFAASFNDAERYREVDELFSARLAAAVEGP